MKPHLQAAAAGVLAGLRSASAPASISRKLEAPIAKRVFSALALAEIAADKLPFAPDRTAKLSLAARILSGAISAACLARTRRRNVLLGAALGSLAAYGATFAAFHLRRSARRRLKLPNAVLGLIEDALALRLGRVVAA